MRRADVRKLLENVAVRFQTAGRAFAPGEEREAVIDHVVSEDAAIGKWLNDNGLSAPRSESSAHCVAKLIQLPGVMSQLPVVPLPGANAPT